MPPLLLISVDKKAESYPFFEQSKVFTVNILADDQEALSRRFAVSGGPKFEGVAYRLGANGAADPRGHARVYRMQACRELSTAATIRSISARSRRRTTVDRKPLLFFRGGYRALGD